MLASLLNQLVGNELAQRYAMPKTHAASGGCVLMTLSIGLLIDGSMDGAIERLTRHPNVFLPRHECLWKVYQATAKGSSNKGEPVSKSEPALSCIE